ncbi:MAG: sugar porter family MFS transporter [Verrucomicrobiota bacterium]
MITSTEPTTPSARTQGDFNATYVWLISSVAAMGGLLFGYDWVVIGGAAKFYEAFFHLKDTAALVAQDAGFWAKVKANAISPTGWAQSCALLGCLAGALMSGALSDRFGRKPLLVLAAANFVLSSVGIALAQGFSAFVIWRILGGMSIGLASNISPMYISEIAPPARRGLLVAINQLTIVIGVLAAQFVNWCIARPVPDGLSPAEFAASWNVVYGWRWMFAACAVPSVLFLLGSFFVPESPRWLTKAGAAEKAERTLSRIGGCAYAAAALGEIRATLVNEDKHVRLGELLERRVLVVLGLGIFLAVFQQWCGINVIFNYAGEIFKQAGYNINDTLTNIVMTGLVNFLFTFVALFTVDRLGRKPLMLFGAAALAVIYTAIGYCYHLKGGGGLVPNTLFLGLVLAAIAAYSMSLAPVTWVIISEIFPNRIRGSAMSIAVGFLWIACFLLTYTFPIFNAVLGPSVTFWIYAAICCVGFVGILTRLPETKGKTLEQIEKDLVD